MNSKNFIYISKKEKEILLKNYKRALTNSQLPQWPFTQKDYDMLKDLRTDESILFFENIDFDFIEFRSSWVFRLLLACEDIDVEEKSILSDLKDKFNKRLKFYKNVSILIPVKPTNNKSSKLICDIIQTVELDIGLMDELGKPREYYKRVLPTKEHCELLIERINSNLTYESPMPMFSFRKEVARVLRNIENYKEKYVI